MKGQTFPTIILAIAVLVFAILLVYSIVVITHQNPVEKKNLTKSKFSTQEDTWSYVRQVNSNQICQGQDTDGDEIGDTCDNCPNDFNPEQEDRDGNGAGDVCDNQASSGGGSSVRDDECDSNSDCGTDGYINDAFCSGRNVVRSYRAFQCESPGRSHSSCSQNVTAQIISACNGSCSDGVCVQGCSSNSDCGTDGFITQGICSPNNSSVYKFYKSFTCNFPGTTQSSCASTTTQPIVENCTNGCANGQCLLPPNVTCSHDSDCGADGFIGSRSCSGLNILQPYKDHTCKNPGTTQSYCFQNMTNRTVDSCQEFCANGQCLDVECFNDAGCNDNNSTTQDICVNAGTPQSNCIHNPLNITCFQDAQCGANGFIQSPFCLNLDIFRKFRTWDCVNAGTPQSHCAFSDQNQFIQTCSDACVNGTCKTVVCNSNLACGTDGYAGERYCRNNSVYRMFEQFTCVMPGLPGSYCSSQETPYHIEDCDYDCLNGACIRCDENSDCNDNNSTTQDSCMLPGSPFSYCENVPIQTCQNECSQSGQRTCSNNGYKVCGDFDSDSCLEWSQITACSYGEVCQSGYCNPTCQSECTPGSRRCSTNGYQVCGDYDADPCAEWSQTTLCSYGQTCNNGYCI